MGTQATYPSRVGVRRVYDDENVGFADGTRGVCCGVVQFTKHKIFTSRGFGRVFAFNG